MKMIPFKQFLNEGPLSAIPAQKGIKRNFFHGNYGGFGNRGGKPVDKLDVEFQKHDTGYYHSKKPEDKKRHDAALVKSTGKLVKDKSLPLITRAKAGMAHTYFKAKSTLDKRK